MKNKQSICDLGAEFRMRRKEQLENELQLLMQCISSTKPQKTDLEEQIETLGNIFEKAAIDFRKFGEAITPLEKAKNKKFTKQDALDVLIAIVAGLGLGLMIGHKILN